MFLVIHIGAGFHSPSKEKEYKKLIKECLLTGKQLLLNKVNGVKVITQVIKKLEDSELTNAGFGSNLNILGKVELDASLMEGKNQIFTSVGAMKNIRNPIELCESMMAEYNKGHWSLGRIPPIMLSGEYNKVLNSVYNIPVLESNDESISQSSLKQYKKYLNKLKLKGNDGSNDYNIIKSMDSGNNNNDNSNDINNTTTIEEPVADKLRNSSFYDTVGAICIDHSGDIVSGCSSGGISLKLPGRIGEASIKKLGCYSENPSIENNLIGVGYSCTGMGEHLTTINLGDLVSNNFKEFLIQSELEDEIFDSQYLSAIDYLNPKLNGIKDHPSLTQFDLKLMGILFMGIDSKNNDLHLLKCFSTPSMGSGYWSSKKDEIRVSIDYKEEAREGPNGGKWCLIGNKFKL